MSTQSYPESRIPFEEAARRAGPTESGVGDRPSYFLAELAKLLPRGRDGRPVHVSTIHRWILRGLRTPEGVIRLEATRVGGRWMVSEAGLRQFTERLTHARRSQQSATPATERRSVRAERTEAELRALGF
jgi:hypothetical protein